MALRAGKCASGRGWGPPWPVTLGFRSKRAYVCSAGDSKGRIMSIQKWAIEQSQRTWQRQAGTIAMLKNDSRRTHRPGMAHSTLLIERSGRLQQG
jgi:hypothetical protein